MKKILIGMIIVLMLLLPSVSAINVVKSNKEDDTTPPVTTILLDPPQPTGLNGWYVDPIEVTLTATDDLSGVDTTYYSINSEPWEVYDGPFLLNWDGLYHIVYFSVDNAGNMEFPKLSRLMLDQTPPDTSLECGEAYKEDGEWYIKVILIGTDATSGMDSWLDFYINDVLQYHYEFVHWPTFKTVIKLFSGFGSCTFKFGCSDLAGNSAFESVDDLVIKSQFNGQSNSQQPSSPLFLQILQRLIIFR